MVAVVGGCCHTAEVILCSVKAFGEGSDFTQSDGPKTGQPISYIINYIY